MLENKIRPRYSRYLNSVAQKQLLPISGTFELTPLCNMNCKMCYVRKSKEEQEEEGSLLKTVDWIKIAKEAVDQGLLYLLITGGEPFLYPGVLELLEELNKLGLVISLNTNGTLITEEVVERLTKFPPVKINITLYGASNETYSKLCQNPNGFDQVMNAIHLLKDKGFNIKLNCSVTPYNKQDLPEMIKIAERENLIIETAGYMFPPVRKNKKLIGNNFRLSPEEAAELRAQSYLRNHGENDFRLTAESFKSDRNQTDLLSVKSYQNNLKVRCGAGRDSFWINWKGQMLPCGMFPVNPIDIKDKGFIEGWNMTVDFIKSLTLSKKCAGCPDRKNCSVCAASMFAETGNFDSAPEYICKYMNATKQAFIKGAEQMGNNKEKRKENYEN